MSDNCDYLATMEFRNFIASFAKELAAEEVYEVAYVWLQKRGDVDKFLPSCNPRACGLELLAKLECSGVFSRKDVSGLREIAKRINRSDLVDKVDAFTKDSSKKKRRTNKTECPQRKGSSEERKELEKTFETMVVEMAVLEQHISLLQRTLCQEKTDWELMDEGREIIKYSSEIAQKLALNLSQVQKRLANRSRSNSSASGSSDGSNSSGGVAQMESAPCPTDVAGPPNKSSLSSESQSKGVKPTPKPRTRIGQSGPIQESTGDSAHQPSSTVTSHPHGTLPTPQVPHRSASAVPSSPSPALSVPEVRLEEDEGTGDSGMETGSGSAYSTPHMWRHLIPTPPPATEKKNPMCIYMSLKDETRDEDLPYETMEYNSET